MSISFPFPLSLFVIVATTGCAVKDVSPELTAAQQLLAQTQQVLGPDLEVAARRESEIREEALIVSMRPVVESSNCTEVNDFELAPGCELVAATPREDGEASATSVLELLDALRGYYAALQGIAAAGDGDRVQAAVNALGQSVAQANDSGIGAFSDLAARFESDGARTAGTVGFLTEQYRMGALRRIVREADPLIADALENAAEYYPSTQELTLLLFNLRDAEQEMISVRSDPAASRIAIRNFRAAYARFVRAQEESELYRLWLLREVHAELNAKLHGNASLDDVLGLLNRIEAILKTN